MRTHDDGGWNLMQGCESVVSIHVVSGDPMYKKSHFTEDNTWSIMQHSATCWPQNPPDITKALLGHPDCGWIFLMVLPRCMEWVGLLHQDWDCDINFFQVINELQKAKHRMYCTVIMLPDFQNYLAFGFIHPCTGAINSSMISWNWCLRLRLSSPEFPHVHICN